jgi:hypothetical protein
MIEVINELRERIAKLEDRKAVPKAALDMEDAARYVDMSVTTLHQAHQRGEGPNRTRNGRKWSYRIIDLDAWLAQRAAS